MLTSSAVGVLVGSVVNLMGQILERRARRDELLLTKALEVAIKQSEKRGDMVTDDVIKAETYYRWLKSLLDTGQLPKDADSRPRK